MEDPRNQILQANCIKYMCIGLQYYISEETVKAI